MMITNQGLCNTYNPKSHPFISFAAYFQLTLYAKSSAVMIYLRNLKEA